MATRRVGVPGWELFAALLVLGVSIYVLSRILLPFVIAAGLAYVASPLIGWAVRYLHLPRALAVLLLYVVVLGSLSTFGYFYGPSLLAAVEATLNELPNIMTHFGAQVFGQEQVQLLGLTLNAKTVAQYLISSMEGFLQGSGELTQLTTLAIEVAVGTVLTLTVLFYLLIDESWLERAILRLTAPERRPQMRYLLVQIDQVLGRYLRGLLFIIIYAAATAWLGLGLLFHLPYAVPIAVATGFLELVPVIGPITSWGIAGLAAFLHGGAPLMIEVIVFYGIFRLALDSFVGPIVLGRAVTLHPVVIIFALLAGGLLLGVLGVLLAIPVAAVLKVVMENLHVNFDDR